VLLRGIFEATEVKTPTTFIILEEVNATEPPITPEITQGLSLTHPRMRSYSIARRSTSRI